MLVDVMGAFDEVHMKPRRCVYGTQSCLRIMEMKHSVNVGNTQIDG
jgi:hypothetical protein